MADTELLVGGGQSNRRGELLGNCSTDRAWFSPNSNTLIKPMTLIVSFQTIDNKIVIAADSLMLSPPDPLDRRDNYTYPHQKIKTVPKTGWVVGTAGVSQIETFQSRIDAEIELGIRAPLNPDIRIGGPIYLDALIRFANEAAVGNERMPSSITLLAGFASDRTSRVLCANPPMPGCFDASRIYPVGAQDATAHWIMRTLGANCTSTEDVKRLAYFTIWQVSKQDARVGRIEAGYPVNLCTMSANEAPQFEQLDALPEWMRTLEISLQECFQRAVRR